MCLLSATMLTLVYFATVYLCYGDLTLHEVTNSVAYVSLLHRTSVDGERFAGLNIRGFSAIKVFAELFSYCLGHKQCISTHYLV